ncbi:MAG TPA: hypothetical protein VIH17_04775 [Candidatus Acidoferrales bacterium]
MIESFHRLLRGALCGEAAGWRGLAALMGPTAGAVGAHYFPGIWSKEEMAAEEVLLELYRNGAKRLREFQGTAENEFLLFLRQIIWELGEGKGGAGAAETMRPELFEKLLEGLAYVPRQILAVSAKGYQTREIEKILEIDKKHAEEVIEAAKEKLRALEGERYREDTVSGGWAALRAAHEEDKKEGCVSDKTFVRISEGQITWREKEAAEQHMASCLYCLDRWTNFQEMRMYYSSLPPAADGFIESVVRKMGFPTQEKKKSFLAKVSGMLKR